MPGLNQMSIASRLAIGRLAIRRLAGGSLVAFCLRRLLVFLEGARDVVGQVNREEREDDHA